MSHAQRAARVQDVDIRPAPGEQQGRLASRRQEAGELRLVQPVAAAQHRPAHRVADYARRAAAVGADVPARDLGRAELGDR